MFSKARQIFSALSHEERLAFSGALLVAFFSLAFLGLNAFNRMTTEVPVRGGSYTEGVIGQPTYINPVIAVSEADRDLVALRIGDDHPVQKIKRLVLYPLPQHKSLAFWKFINNRMEPE